MKTPIIKAIEDPNTKFLSFKCKWCGKVHYHGEGYGQRASHCSVFLGDYILIPEEKK